jgi:ribosomal-protein-alanine N-acetyltransferase
MHTSRTRLRRIQESDFANLRRLESDELVMRYTSVQRALSDEETRARMQRWMERKGDGEFGTWVAETHDGHFVGWFMLKPGDDRSLEIGFMILQEMWGKGFTSEIATRLKEHAGSRKLTARVHPENSVSFKVLEKLGFRKVMTEGGTVHLIANERPQA